MTLDEVMRRLNDPGVAVDRLLDETRGPDLALWQKHPELYPAFVERLLDHGHPGRALELGREGVQHLAGDPRLQYLLALAAARGGATTYAETLLAPLLARATNSPPADMPARLRVDVIALQGRLLKDRSDREPGLAAESARWYELAAASAGRDPDLAAFPLINAATMWRVAGDREQSEALAAEVVGLVSDRAEAAAAGGQMWPAATLGEALVLLGQYEEAVRWYLRAAAVANARGEVGKLAAMRNNVRRLRAAGATADPAFLDEHLGRVVVFRGHMIDSPDRRAERPQPPPRFPQHAPLVKAAAAAIRDRLDRLNARVGYCSLACGGDILFAEAMLDRGAELHVVLPFAPADFLRTSVDFGQHAPEWRRWRGRFDAVLERVEAQSRERVRYVTHEPYLGSHDLFALADTVLQGLAVLRARERASVPAALTLVDRSSPAAPGGTVGFLAAWTAAGLPAEEVDLAALRAQHPAPATPEQKPAQPPTRSTLPRPVRAMLFADVAGYSGISEWQLPAFLTAYGAYLRVLFHSDVGRGAVYANTWGDGLYAVFKTAADAAAFATELVEPRLGSPPNWSEFGLGPTNPVRVGLHAGPVFQLDDLFQGRPEFAGQHVTRAARIEPVTVRGCAYASEPFAALLAMTSPTRFAVEAVGVHSLAKNYDRCPLYQVRRA